MSIKAPPRLIALAQTLQAAKRDEDAAKEKRVAAEKAIVALCGFTKAEGQETYEVSTPIGSVAKVTINRPQVRNAFRPQTVVELIKAFGHVRNDSEVGVAILTGEGPEAFCSGGDQNVRGHGGYVIYTRRENGT